MINHLRTLLLNVSGSNNPGPSFPGEEYVPPAYVEKDVPAALRPVYRTLFPGDSDRAYKNLRLRQLMAALHGSELSPYVTAPDPRVTYVPFRRDLFDDLLPVGQVVQLAGAAKTFYLYGVSSTIQAQGRIRFQWRVDVVDNANVRVRQFDDRQQMVTELTYPYTESDALSSVLLLPGSSLSFRFESGVGSAWLVDALARPSQSLPQVVDQLDRVMAGDAADALFGPPAEPAEPYRTCRNLWERHHVAILRLAAVTLALAYRLDAASAGV